MADNSKSIQIRKLRKKLRQIEHLEQVDRELTEEEYSKVLTKNIVRKELKKLVAEREKEQQHAEKMTHEAENQTEQTDQTGRNQGINSGGNDEEREQPATQVKNEPGILTSDSKNSNVTSQSSPSPQQPSSSSSPQQPSSSSPQQPTSSSPQQPSSSTNQSTAQSQSSSSTASSSSSPSPPSIVKSSSPKSSSSSQPYKEWVDAVFSVQYLEGHNDIVLDVDCDETIVVSGSRDTTLKLWDAESGHEIRSMGGHTGSVTSVKLIPYIDITLDEEESSLTKAFQHMAITGSKDCSIRLWTLGDGQMRRSIYTYSSVECLDYNKRTIASGSEGGKVELWDINTGGNVRSIKGHEDIVTCIKFQDDGRVVSGSMKGVVKVWDVRDSALRPVFDSEKTDLPYKQRQIRSLVTRGDSIYWGDDGANIKVLDLASGKLRKVRNHEKDFGSTNAMTTCKSCLISTGYDIDNGLGYMNIRSLPDESYLATINDNNTGCITCLSCTQVKKDGHTLNRICTGGSDLKLWNQLPPRAKKRLRSECEDGFVSSKQIRRYSQRDLSDTESSEEDDDDDNPHHHHDDDDDDDGADHASNSWCTIS